MADPLKDPVLGTLEFDEEGVAEVLLDSDAGDLTVFVCFDGEPDADALSQCTDPLKDLFGLYQACIREMADALEVLEEYGKNNGVEIPKAGEGVQEALADLFVMKDASVQPEEEEDVLKVDFVAIDGTDTEIESEDVICVTFDRDGDAIEVSMER